MERVWRVLDAYYYWVFGVALILQVWLTVRLVGPRPTPDAPAEVRERHEAERRRVFLRTAVPAALVSTALFGLLPFYVLGMLVDLIVRGVA